MINHNLGLLIISCLVLAIILYVFFWMRWNNKRKITIREQEEERLRVLEIEKQIEADRNEKISFTNHHLKYSLKVDSNLDYKIIIDGFYHILFQDEKYPEHFDINIIHEYPIEVIETIYEILEDNLDQEGKLLRLENKKYKERGYDEYRTKEIRRLYKNNSLLAVIKSFLELTDEDIRSLINKEEKLKISRTNEIKKSAQQRENKRLEEQKIAEERENKRLEELKIAEEIRVKEENDLLIFKGKKAIAEKIIQTSYGLIIVDDNESGLPGVYVILNTTTLDLYIGSSKNMKKRKQEHLHNLKAGNHHSYKLQESFNQHHIEAFIFHCLEYVSELSELRSKEQKYIDQYRPMYNIEMDASSRSYLTRKNIRY